MQHLSCLRGGFGMLRQCDSSASLWWSSWLLLQPSQQIRREVYSTGVAVSDYDNDGYEDIFVAGFGRNTLYHNNGDGTFTDVTDSAGVAGGGWSTSAAWLDYDKDGRLDLIVIRYLAWDFKDVYCGEHRPGYR